MNTCTPVFEINQMLHYARIGLSVTLELLREIGGLLMDLSLLNVTIFDVWNKSVETNMLSWNNICEDILEQKGKYK